MVFVLLIFGSLVVMAKPAWEDKEDSGLPGKISFEYMRRMDERDSLQKLPILSCRKSRDKSREIMVSQKYYFFQGKQ